MITQFIGYLGNIAYNYCIVATKVLQYRNNYIKDF